MIASLNLVQWVAILSGIASIGIAFNVGESSSPTDFMILLAFVAWVLAPHLVALFLAGRYSRPRLVFVLAMILVVAVCAGGVYVYARTFYFNPSPDAQDALAFAALPLYQLLALGVGWLVLSIAKRFA